MSSKHRLTRSFRTISALLYGVSINSGMFLFVSGSAGHCSYETCVQNRKISMQFCKRCRIKDGNKASRGRQREGEIFLFDCRVSSRKTDIPFLPPFCLVFLFHFASGHILDVNKQKLRTKQHYHNSKKSSAT
jgi:hypothetical protein